jgi:hypothetical protein
LIGSSDFANYCGTLVFVIPKSENCGFPLGSLEDCAESRGFSTKIAKIARYLRTAIFGNHRQTPARGTHRAKLAP